MPDDLIEHEVPVPLIVDLGEQVFGYRICSHQGGSMPIREFDLVDTTSVEDWRVVIRRPYGETILIPKQLPDQEAQPLRLQGVRQAPCSGRCLHARHPG